MSNSQPTPSTVARAATVDALCEHLSGLGRADRDLLCRFARVFFEKAPRSLLEDRDPDQLAALTIGAWEFLCRARPDEVNVEVTNPEE